MQFILRKLSTPWLPRHFTGLRSLSSTSPFSLLTLTENFRWAPCPSHALSAGGCFLPTPLERVCPARPLPAAAVQSPCPSEIRATGPSRAGPSLLLSFTRLCDSRTLLSDQAEIPGGLSIRLLRPCHTGLSVPCSPWLHPSQTNQSPGHVHFLSSAETLTSAITSSPEPPRPPACSRGHSFHSPLLIAASHDCPPLASPRSLVLLISFFGFIVSPVQKLIISSFVPLSFDPICQEKPQLWLSSTCFSAPSEAANKDYPVSQTEAYRSEGSNPGELGPGLPVCGPLFNFYFKKAPLTSQRGPLCLALSRGVW